MIKEMLPNEVMAFMKGQNESESISQQSRRSMSLRSIKSFSDDRDMKNK